MKIIIAPSKYIQGKDALKELTKYGKVFGKKFLILADEFVTNLTKDLIVEGNSNEDVELSFALFNGECSKNEINRISEIVKENGSDVIVGVGGGKTLDTAKAVAHYTKLPVIIAPTLASTDAPTSALSVIYTDSGVFDEYLLLPKNPEIVLMDTEVIANAPTRLLVSGMGDALATYYEARVCYAAKAVAMAGGQPTMSAMALATLCKNTLFERGYAAKLSSDANIASEAFEEVVEANTYLSGIGFESTGIAAAHAIHNGFTAIEDCHHLYHGEKVAYGTIAQLVLENAPSEEIQKVIDFCQLIGLPTTLVEMGVKGNLEEKMRIVAEASCAEGETIHNFPYEITPAMVYDAILLADKLGQR
ncbi:MAG: glycerol dehydrogenase [Candidatus Delongbacteria bacterium]|jgi:glycerol dehydrogenase|nr:glycerol dehydrogenase [Candidatus Delongbacteria bacterium]